MKIDRERGREKERKRERERGKEKSGVTLREGQKER